MAKYKSPQARARDEDPIRPSNKKKWIKALNKVSKELELPKYADYQIKARPNYMARIEQALDDIQLYREFTSDPLTFRARDFMTIEDKTEPEFIQVDPGPKEQWDFDLLQVLQLIRERAKYNYEKKYGDGSAELAKSAANQAAKGDAGAKDSLVELAQSSENAHATAKNPTGANQSEASPPPKPAPRTRRKANVPPEQPSKPNGVVPAAQSPGLTATQGQTKGEAAPTPAAEQGEPSTGVAQGALTIPPTANKKEGAKHPSKVTKVPPEQASTPVPAAQDGLADQSEHDELAEPVVPSDTPAPVDPRGGLEQVEADAIIEQEVPTERQSLINKLGLIKPHTQIQEIELNEISLSQKSKFNTIDPWQMCNVESSENPVYRFAFRLTEHEKNNQLFLNPEIFIQILDNLKPKEYRVQMELGELTQKKHYQGFLKLNDKKRAKQLAKELNPVAYGIDVKPARDEFALKAYCTKIETRIKGPWIYPP